MTLGHRAAAGWRAYAVALAAIGVALLLTGLLTPLTDEDVLFPPLVGTVVIVSVYCGVGPALAATAVGWLLVPFALMEPRWSAWPESKADTTRWAVGLAVALVLIWASWTLQRLREQERRRATEAEATSAVASELHALAAALASAAEPSDVAGALLARVPALLGSVGGSLGLVEGDDLVIVAPTRGARPILRPGLRLPLSTSAPITEAARTGEAALRRDACRVRAGVPGRREARTLRRIGARRPAARRGAGHRRDRVPVQPSARRRRERALARSDRSGAGRAGAPALARLRARAQRTRRARAHHAARPPVRGRTGGRGRGRDLRGGARGVRRGRRAAVEGRRRTAEGDLARSTRRPGSSGSCRRAP